MLGSRSGAGAVVRREAAAIISDARATSKHVNVIKEGVEAEQDVDEEVRVCVAVAEATPRSLALVVRDALAPVRPHATVRVMAAADAAVAGGSWDVVVAIADGRDLAIADVERVFARAGMPVAVVAASRDDLPDAGLAGPVARRVTSVVGVEASDVRGQLASWLVRATGKGLAMAACFPFARRAETEVLARECAGQNAVVGAFGLVPGSDLPVMAANQVRLAITYATLYGQGASFARLVEMVGAVGASVAYRRLAKALSVPGLGMLARAGVGYGGTLLTGRTLARYYERLDAEGGLGNAVAHVARDASRQAARTLARRASVPFGGA